MATVSIAPEALRDLERLSAFLESSDPAAASDTVTIVAGGLSILQAHPLIGRQVDDEQRELVISRGDTGYVALYAYHEPSDRVTVLAIHHQREAGYGD